MGTTNLKTNGHIGSESMPRFESNVVPTASYHDIKAIESAGGSVAKIGAVMRPDPVGFAERMETILGDHDGKIDFEGEIQVLQKPDSVTAIAKTKFSIAREAKHW